jgi:predicted RNA binding protein YcfA (HicA-like mRNA interferase family)
MKALGAVDACALYDREASRFGDFHFVCTIHTMQSAVLIKKLEKNGWVLRSVKGSHHVYVHPTRPGHLTVPHPRKDLGMGLVHKLLKAAGLK